jgi:hypothetical protein
MKSSGDILRELGFNKEAPRDTQKAFLKHLLQAAGIKPLNIQEDLKTQLPKKGEQLAFSFDDDKKVS